MKEAVWIVAVVAVLIGFVAWAMAVGASNDEIGECHKWQEQAAQFSGFYLVQWQADQCVAHNITINAPVR